VRVAYIIGALGALVVLPVACSAYSTWSTVTSAPARVINKTLRTDNIISNYELFHDESTQFSARLAQIKEHAGFLTAETDPAERTRLRMEMGAQQQSCRELAADYNANSAKLNRALFKDSGLPPVLDAAACETPQG
jgi:hypothetical protein